MSQFVASHVLITAQHSDFRSSFSPGEVEMKEKVLPPSPVQTPANPSLLPGGGYRTLERMIK